MKPKVLMICCDGFENGGIQAVIMSIVRTLSNEIQFDAIVFNEGNQYYTDEFLKHGKIHRFHRVAGKGIKKNVDEFTRCVRYEMEFDKFLTENEPYDIIHCHNYFESAPFLKVAKKRGISVRIAHSHNVASTQKRKNPLYPLLQNYYKKMIRKYATSRISCSVGAGKYLFDNDDVLVVNNAIDLDRFNPKKYEAKQDGLIKFIHVGRFSKQKNQLFLLDVFYCYHKLNPNSTLSIIGFGELESKLNQSIKELELQNAVRLLPSDSNVAKAYADADFMIFPSTYEGLGISLIEAQAMGLTCFVSEAVQPEADLGLCEFLKLDWGAEKWAMNIANYIELNGLKKKYVDMSSYDINNIKKKYLEIYLSRQEEQDI